MRDRSSTALKETTNILLQTKEVYMTLIQKFILKIKTSVK